MGIISSFGLICCLLLIAVSWLSGDWRLKLGSTVFISAFAISKFLGNPPPVFSEIIIAYLALNAYGWMLDARVDESDKGALTHTVYSIFGRPDAHDQAHYWPIIMMTLEAILIIMHATQLFVQLPTNYFIITVAVIAVIEIFVLLSIGLKRIFQRFGLTWNHFWRPGAPDRVHHSLIVDLYQRIVAGRKQEERQKK